MAVNPSSLAQIPLDLADPVVLRRFLAALVENLDTVLGYRQSSDTISINELKYTAATVSTTYNQAEMQELSDRIGAVASALDDLLIALKTNKQVV